MKAHFLANEILRKAGIGCKSLSVIQMNRSGPGETSMALMIFIDQVRYPAAFVKISPDPGKSKSLELEFNNLSFLWDCGSPQFTKAIPKTLYFGKINQFTVLAETAKPGTRLKNLPPNAYFSSLRFRHHFEIIVQWLYEFNRCMADHHLQVATPHIKGALIDTVKEYRQNFRYSAKLEYLLDKTVDLLHTGKIPLYHRHGDFCTANIIASQDQHISVVDWEHPMDTGWPLFDLIYFISSVWCIPHDKSKRGRVNNYRHLFFSRHRHVDLIRQSVAWYMQKLGIKADLSLPLSIIAWVMYANEKKADELKTGTDVDAVCNTAEPLPLTIIENSCCLNLELLAENHEKYILASLF